MVNLCRRTELTRRSKPIDPRASVDHFCSFGAIRAAVMQRYVSHCSVISEHTEFGHFHSPALIPFPSHGIRPRQLILPDASRFFQMLPGASNFFQILPNASTRPPTLFPVEEIR